MHKQELQYPEKLKKAAIAPQTLLHIKSYMKSSLLSIWVVYVLVLPLNLNINNNSLRIPDYSLNNGIKVINRGNVTCNTCAQGSMCLYIHTHCPHFTALIIDGLHAVTKWMRDKGQTRGVLHPSLLTLCSATKTSTPNLKTCSK
jgi:hypothetical protein